MRKIYLTSDTHYFHNLLSTLGDRPEGFWEEMTANMYHIRKEDMLIHLGDICIGQDLRAHDEYLSLIKGTKILVRGNHDNKSNSWYLSHGWDFVCRSFSDVYHGKNIIFTHIPLKEHDYDVNIHGHFHNNKRFHPEAAGANPSKYFLISIEENKLKPLFLETILKKHIKK